MVGSFSRARTLFSPQPVYAIISFTLSKTFSIADLPLLAAPDDFIIEAPALAAVGANVFLAAICFNPAQKIRTCAIKIVGAGRAEAHD